MPQHGLPRQLLDQLVGTESRRSARGREDDGKGMHGENAQPIALSPCRCVALSSSPGGCGDRLLRPGLAWAVADVPSFPSRPKIIRPCTVCRVLVTTNSTSSFTCCRPPSTTTIVPSSRYPTPWPAVSP